jgi:ABC-type Fe3+-citrate transport system substrate-binding protein
MSNFQKMLLLVLPLMICGCHRGEKTVPKTMSNVGVTTSSAPSAKFPSGRKYAFVKPSFNIEDGSEAALIYQRIQKALTKELKSKRYKLSESADASMLVAYTVGIEQEINVLATKSKEHGNEWITAFVVPNDYITGALLVQIIDAKSFEPVWLGVVNADVTLASVSEKEKQARIGYAVHELLKTFPPK